jgi:hypothetical protein
MSYNRRKVLRSLGQHGIVILREGGGHTVLASRGGLQATIPRHGDIDRWTTRAVVKQLGLDWSAIKKEIR